jgi:hypothetical protein
VKEEKKRDVPVREEKGRDVLVREEKRRAGETRQAAGRVREEVWPWEWGRVTAATERDEEGAGRSGDSLSIHPTASAITRRLTGECH